MRKKVSLKDIAKQSGTSTALVSYVLNGKLTDKINPATSHRIKQLAQQLNYYPNQVAKSLKNSKTLMLGLIVADISNLYSSTIARVIEDAARVHGYNVLFSSADENPEKFSELVQVYMNRQVDGIILACPKDVEQKLQYLEEQRIPFVMIDRYFPDLKGMNSVTINNYKASYNVVTHLIKKGYKNPAMITLSSKLHHLQDRVSGFEDAVIRLLNQEKAKVVAVEENMLAEEMESVIIKLCKDKSAIDALYFSTNKIAIEGLSVLVRHCIAVPEEVAVVCFDEVDAYKLFHKSITHVKQPLDKIGSKVVELVLDRINNSADAQQIVLDAILIEGESSKRL